MVVRWHAFTPALLLILSVVILPGLAVSESESLEELEGGARTKATKLMAITGDSDFGDERTAWDKTYSRQDYVFGKDPADFLIRFVDKLPKGRALDIATGEGRNAVYLAKKGFQVEGVDISNVGLRKARRLAAENGVRITTINADLNRYKIRPGRYTVILNFLYLQRSLFPQIREGLQPGGMIVFENHTTDQLKNPKGETWEREYLLSPGELREAFSDWEIIHYSETNNGKDALARLVARKPESPKENAPAKRKSNARSR
jgi:tellurite methyltransferase